MSLSLDDKQLLRSISDLIIHQPEHINLLLNNHPEIADIGILKKIPGIVALIKNYRLADMKDDNFFHDLNEEIDKLSNKDIKEIFRSSIDSSEHSPKQVKLRI